ncbi:hypothetical protein [Bacillus aquiflavi]|nr:hypothetical protein [Bacillus aquiflavi]
MQLTTKYVAYLLPKKDNLEASYSRKQVIEHRSVQNVREDVRERS